MAAGLGFKTFTTGEVLTSADVNGYLMQGVLVFASAATRDAAITSPQEGQFAFTKDTNGLWYYDGATWVASGATGDIEGVTAGVGISGGGTSGTVTVTNSMATAMTTKGDLVPATGSGTFSRLAVGSNTQVLTADSTAATGMKWAAVASSSGPAFSAYVSANQTIPATTFTKANFDAESFDTDSCYDTTNKRFTPTTAGKYFVNATTDINATGTTEARLYKNGSVQASLFYKSQGAEEITNGGYLVDMNGSTDYLEIFIYVTAGTRSLVSGSSSSYWSAQYVRS